MTEITGFDVIVVGVIIASAAYAAWKGLLRESLSIFAWALAAYAALVFGPMLRVPLHDIFTPKWLGDVIAYAGVFLIVLVPLSFLSFRFSESIQKSPVGPVDRSLGFVFGLGRGLVLVALPYIAFTMLVHAGDQPDWIKRAATLPMVRKTSEVMLSMVPNQDRHSSDGVPEKPADRHQHVQTSNAEVAEKPVAATQSPPAKPARPQHTAGQETRQKTYSPRERRELDRLIETTGGDGSQSQ